MEKTPKRQLECNLPASHPWQETLHRDQSTHKHTHMRKLIAASAAWGPSSQKSDQATYLGASAVQQGITEQLK